MGHNIKAGNQSKIGLVVLPFIFGQTGSFLSYVRRWQEAGHSTIIVDPYRCFPKPHKPPFFLLKVAFNEKANVDRLAASFHHLTVIDAILNARMKLLDQGCKKIAYIGFGLGGVQALWAAEHRQYSPDLVVAFYPHLIFPRDFPKKAPDFSKIEAKIMLFFGKQEKITAESLHRAKLAALTYPHVDLNEVPDADHAFAEGHIQKKWGINIPNWKYYRPDGAGDAISKVNEALSALRPVEPECVNL